MNAGKAPDITDAQRARAGRVWKEADAVLATALIWLAYRYPPERCENLTLIPWDEFGRENQNDITRAVDSLATLIGKATR